MKKLTIKHGLIALGVVILGFSSCSKDIDTINKTNPNQFGGSQPSLMITGAQMANVLIQEGELARMSGIFTGYFVGADRQYISLNSYKMLSTDLDNAWNSLYSEGIAQCRLIKDLCKKSNNKELAGVASITEAQLLLTASSLWGDVPNSEACNDNILAPKFDKMSDVHKYCIALLDSAIPNVTGSSSYAAAYAGNFDWAEVANTLKARAYLRMKDYANAKAAAQNGVALGHDLNANHSTASPGAWNLYYDFLDYDRPGYLGCDGAWIVQFLDTANKNCRNNAKTDETPRFKYYFTPNNYTALDPNMVDGIFATTSNYALVTYAENELILAECESRLGSDANALVHLNNVRSELNNAFGGYSSYNISDFGPGQMIKGSTATEALLKEILMEKYVCLYGQLETFADVRRTKNALGLPDNSGNGKGLPQRFLVPQTEINSNSNAPKNTTDIIFSPVELFK